jgi:hypothetical protein
MPAYTSQKTTRIQLSGPKPCEIHLASKASAFWDGFGTLLDLFPTPRTRCIRAYYLEGANRRSASVKAAIARDWVAVGQDMRTAIAKYEESPEETAIRSSPITAR